LLCGEYWERFYRNECQKAVFMCINKYWSWKQTHPCFPLIQFSARRQKEESTSMRFWTVQLNTMGEIKLRTPTSLPSFDAFFFFVFWGVKRQNTLV